MSAGDSSAPNPLEEKLEKPEKSDDYDSSFDFAQGTRGKSRLMIT